MRKYRRMCIGTVSPAVSYPGSWVLRTYYADSPFKRLKKSIEYPITRLIFTSKSPLKVFYHWRHCTQLLGTPVAEMYGPRSTIIIHGVRYNVVAQAIGCTRHQGIPEAERVPMSPASPLLAGQRLGEPESEWDV
jgi:hypothetical protein